MKNIRKTLAGLPRLARDVRDYARYRRGIYAKLAAKAGGIRNIESVSLYEALRRVHAQRFPGTTLPALAPFDFSLTEDLETLELMYLAYICRVAAPETIFEIGTYEGRSANIMALHSGEHCHIHTLDLPVEGEIETALPIAQGDDVWLAKQNTRIGSRIGASGSPGADAKIQLLFGDSARFDYSPWQGQIDLAFVDGAHSYDYVMSDAENALQMARPNGVILFHDFLTHDDVTVAITELNQSHKMIHVWDTSYAILFPSSK